jgi:hypothetical protein
MVAAALWRCRLLEATSPDSAVPAAALESVTAMDPVAGSLAQVQVLAKKAPAPDPIPKLTAEFLPIPALAVRAPEPMAALLCLEFR